jgi:dTDP-4-amino-4,6-dideoxygalactose transaminase
MAAHASLIRRSLTRLPPGGDSIGWDVCRAVLALEDPEARIREHLEARFGGSPVTLHASGREALRVALAHLARKSGRNEILVPAYTCYSIPAAVIAAGLRLRLIDVDSEGRIDPGALEKVAGERAAAVVVANLLGVPESMGLLRPIANASGIALIDDGAQAVGATSADGPVGGRGAIGVLSFGRGKPISALGGGALVWSSEGGAAEAQPAARPARTRAVWRALAYDVARAPWAFRAFSAIPALGIGATVYDPGFRRGRIDGASLCLAAVLLGRLDADTRERRERAGRIAGRIREETSFRPIDAPSGVGAYPRLGVLAPDFQRRESALESLRSSGATRLYPDPLDRLAALRRHRNGQDDLPGARAFASRLLTLPTHVGMSADRIDEIVARLTSLS